MCLVIISLKCANHQHEIVSFLNAAELHLEAAYRACCPLALFLFFLTLFMFARPHLFEYDKFASAFTRQEASVIT